MLLQPPLQLVAEQALLQPPLQLVTEQALLQPPEPALQQALLEYGKPARQGQCKSGSSIPPERRIISEPDRNSLKSDQVQQKREPIPQRQMKSHLSLPDLRITMGPGICSRVTSSDGPKILKEYTISDTFFASELLEFNKADLSKISSDTMTKSRCSSASIITALATRDGSSSEEDECSNSHLPDTLPEHQPERSESTSSDGLSHKEAKEDESCFSGGQLISDSDSEEEEVEIHYSKPVENYLSIRSLKRPKMTVAKKSSLLSSKTSRTKKSVKFSDTSVRLTVKDLVTAVLAKKATKFVNSCTQTESEDPVDAGPCMSSSIESIEGKKGLKESDTSILTATTDECSEKLQAQLAPTTSCNDSEVVDVYAPMIGSSVEDIVAAVLAKKATKFVNSCTQTESEDVHLPVDAPEGSDPSTIEEACSSAALTPIKLVNSSTQSESEDVEDVHLPVDAPEGSDSSTIEEACSSAALTLIKLVNSSTQSESEDVEDVHLPVDSPEGSDPSTIEEACSSAALTPIKLVNSSTQSESEDVEDVHLPVDAPEGSDSSTIEEACSSAALTPIKLVNSSTQSESEDVEDVHLPVDAPEGSDSSTIEEACSSAALTPIKLVNSSTQSESEDVEDVHLPVDSPEGSDPSTIEEAALTLIKLVNSSTQSESEDVEDVHLPVDAPEGSDPSTIEEACSSAALTPIKLVNSSTQSESEDVEDVHLPVDSPEGSDPSTIEEACSSAALTPIKLVNSSTQSESEDVEDVHLPVDAPEGSDSSTIEEACSSAALTPIKLVNSSTQSESEDVEDVHLPVDSPEGSDPSTIEEAALTLIKLVNSSTQSESEDVEDVHLPVDSPEGSDPSTIEEACSSAALTPIKLVNSSTQSESDAIHLSDVEEKDALKCCDSAAAEEKCSSASTSSCKVSQSSEPARSGPKSKTEDKCGESTTKKRHRRGRRGGRLVQQRRARRLESQASSGASSVGQDHSKASSGKPDVSSIKSDVFHVCAATEATACTQSVIDDALQSLEILEGSIAPKCSDAEQFVLTSNSESAVDLRNFLHSQSSEPARSGPKSKTKEDKCGESKTPTTKRRHQRGRRGGRLVQQRRARRLESQACLGASSGDTSTRNYHSPVWMVSGHNTCGWCSNAWFVDN